MSNVTIRKAQLHDCARILQLMKELAIFEGYIRKFRVGLPELRHHLFEQKSIGVLVAIVDKRVEGILVYFFQPFTYDLSSWLVIKELYVAGQYRRLGLGCQLLTALQNVAQKSHCSKIKWEVLTSNTAAKQFYMRHGATLESDWQIMSVEL